MTPGVYPFLTPAGERVHPRESSMRARVALAVGIVLAAFFSTMAMADPGVQVVECYEDPVGSGDWHYTFFVCTGSFSANDFHLELTAAEIGEGTVIIGCDTPAGLPGYGCSHTATMASWTFPMFGAFDCIPGVANEYLEISIHTIDESTIVTELFTVDGNIVAAYTTLVACPPVPVEPSTWGTIKSLYDD
jgi:hypothetical protein